MWCWLLDKWQAFRSARRAQRELSPENLRLLTAEIKEIAYLSGKVWAVNQDLQERVYRISREMDQLDELINRPSFRRLSKEKKRELLSSLLMSKEELLKGLHSAPCPTDKIQ